MTDMDYKQKYKEALTWVESIYQELSHDRQMEAEAFFPELKESEDEKIRKALLEHIVRIDCEVPLGTHHRINGVDNSKIIAWLEKQQGGKDKFTQQHSLKEDSNVNDETNAPTEYGKYVDECLNEASKHFFSEGEDKYSVADLFYAGVRCGKSWLEKQEHKPATIDIDRMVDDYANNKERE